MTNKTQLNMLAVTISALLLTACGDAETTIIEQDPIIVPDDDHDHDHDHDHDGDDDHDHGGDFVIESLGRLAVMDADSNTASVVDLDDNSVLDSFAVTHAGSRLSASADYRFAVLTARNDDHVGFIDGGLWREDHVDHLHDYEQAPEMLSYSLMGSRPTHVVTHDGQMAIFYDGDADAGLPASVQVLTDMDIVNEVADPAGFSYTVNMHGVAEPRGEHLIASYRRDDAETTSSNAILPDQIAVYHLHDGEYEQEQILETACPDLHGAAQNHDYVAFGCGDGVVLVHQHDDEYESVKVANIDALGSLRVGSLYGHEAVENFIGVASNRTDGTAILMAIEPDSNEMEIIDWQQQENARALSYAFAYEGEFFIILDSLGFLTVLAADEHDGHTHWEFAQRIDITDLDVADMPEGANFSMTVAQNGHYAFVADPMAQHILRIDLDSGEIEGDVELDFVPAGITWLGIAEEAHDHD